VIRITTSALTRVTAVCLTGLVATSAVFVSSASASAVTKIHATYKVTGSTFIKAPNFTMALGPGKLTSTLNLKTGKLTANLALPDATGSFKQFGLIPVTATTHFINNGPTTGKVNLTNGAVKTTSSITLQIVSLTVAGLPVPVGDSCETSSPVIITVKSQKGFNVVSGGKLKGTYTIPSFSNCKLATPLINLTLPGAGNTITLKLGKARIG
jgi:hypothetical protein